MPPTERKGLVRAEHCRHWKGDERCGRPAEFIVWGKLFPLDALGPRCYDCAAEQVGHHGLTVGNPQGYAIYHLNDVNKAMAQRDEAIAGCERVEREREEAHECEAELKAELDEARLALRRIASCESRARALMAHRRANPDA